MPEPSSAGRARHRSLRSQVYLIVAVCVVHALIGIFLVVVPPGGWFRLLSLATAALAGPVIIVIAALRMLKAVRVATDRISAVLASDDPRARVGGELGTGELGRLGAVVDRALADTHQRRSTDLAAHKERESRLGAAFVRQRLSEREARRRAQTVVDETSAGVVAELTAVLGHTESMRTATEEIEQRARTADELTRTVVADARGAG